MKKYDALYIFVGIAKEDVLEANLEKALGENSGRLYFLGLQNHCRW